MTFCHIIIQVYKTLIARIQWLRGYHEIHHLGLEVFKIQHHLFCPHDLICRSPGVVQDVPICTGSSLAAGGALSSLRVLRDGLGQEHKLYRKVEEEKAKLPTGLALFSLFSLPTCSPI